MSEDKTKEQLLSELIELRRRLFQYKRITKGARAINQQMNDIWDELISKHGMTKEELTTFELSIDLQGDRLDGGFYF